MVRSTMRSNVRPLVIAEGRPPRVQRTPGVILAFPGCRVPAPPRPITLRARLSLMLGGALAGLAIAAILLF